MVCWHLHPNPLPSRERGNELISISIFGARNPLDKVYKFWYIDLNPHGCFHLALNQRYLEFPLTLSLSPWGRGIG
jgi:hypothetical protein